MDEDLFTVADMFVFTANVASTNVIWSFVKIFKYLQLYTRFLLIWDVLAHSMTKTGGLISFVVVIVLVSLAFSFSGFS